MARQTPDARREAPAVDDLPASQRAGVTASSRPPWSCSPPTTTTRSTCGWWPTGRRGGGDALPLLPVEGAAVRHRADPVGADLRAELRALDPQGGDRPRGPAAAHARGGTQGLRAQPPLLRTVDRTAVLGRPRWWRPGSRPFTGTTSGVVRDALEGIDEQWVEPIETLVLAAVFNLLRNWSFGDYTMPEVRRRLDACVDVIFGSPLDPPSPQRPSPVPQPPQTPAAPTPGGGSPGSRPERGGVRRRGRPSPGRSCRRRRPGRGGPEIAHDGVDDRLRVDAVCPATSATDWPAFTRRAARSAGCRWSRRPP